MLGKKSVNWKFRHASKEEYSLGRRSLEYPMWLLMETLPTVADYLVCKVTKRPSWLKRVQIYASLPGIVLSVPLPLRLLQFGQVAWSPELEEKNPAFIGISRIDTFLR